MKKFNQFFDRWNMVTVLRVVAVILFVLQAGLDIGSAVLNYSAAHSSYMTQDAVHQLYGTSVLILSYFMKGLFQPAILLALAELIRIKKAK